MDYNTGTNRDCLIDLFPKLGDDPNFVLLSDCDDTYNCIAWAMQYTDRWVMPGVKNEAGYWWPEAAESSMTPEALVQAFECEGFATAHDHTVRDGYDKVALYKALDDKGEWVWTHATRIVAEGIEYSKFGEGWDGQHSLGALSGDPTSVYGIPYAYMERKLG